MRRSARRAQASEPRLSVSGLAAKRRGECAIDRVNLSRYFMFDFVTAAAAAAAAAVQRCRLQVRIHGEVRAECASLGLWVRARDSQL